MPCRYCVFTGVHWVSESACFQGIHPSRCLVSSDLYGSVADTVADNCTPGRKISPRLMTTNDLSTLKTSCRLIED